MYLYYDKTRTLKEIINDTAIVSGSVNANKIYVMYEGDQEASYTTSYICYLKGNGEYTDTYLQNAVTNPFATEPSEDCYIPYNEKRDLKFFKYGKPYRFRVFNIPSEDLRGYSSASGTVWYVLDPNNDTTISGGEVINGSDDTAEAMTMFSFAINPSTGYVKKDDYISLSQWNQLLLLISKIATFNPSEITSALTTLQSYFTEGSAKNALKLDDHTSSYFATQSDITALQNAISAIVDTNSWRSIKVNGVEILGTGTNTNALDLTAGANITLSESGGVVTISSSGGGQTSFNLIVCQSASETPDVATISVGGTTISGTLAPSALTLGTLYLCNDATNPVTNDIYTEYVTARKIVTTSETMLVEESDENVNVSTQGDMYDVHISVDTSNMSNVTCNIQYEALQVEPDYIILILSAQQYAVFQNSGATFTYDESSYTYNWEKFGTTPTSVTAGVTSLGGVNGAITLGTGLTMSGSQLKPDGLTKTLIFASGIPQWVSDNTYPDYPYKGTISNLTGVTSSDYAEVVYSVDQASSGNYAPICETGSSCVYVYSKVNNAIIIPTIKVDKIL